MRACLQLAARALVNSPMAQRLLYVSVCVQVLGLFLMVYGAVVLTLGWLNELEAGSTANLIAGMQNPLRPVFYAWWVIFWPAFQLACYFFHDRAAGRCAPLPATERCGTFTDSSLLTPVSAFPNELSFLCVALVSESLLIPFARDCAELLLLALEHRGPPGTNVKDAAVLAAGAALSAAALFFFILSMATLVSDQMRIFSGRSNSMDTGRAHSMDNWGAAPAVGVVVHRAVVEGQAAAPERAPSSTAARLSAIGHRA